MIILHGLFGSFRNWSHLAEQLSGEYCVYLLDLRNHGGSPHAQDMDYLTMSADVIAYMDAQGLKTATVLGHSMGGKVAMWLALSEPQRVQKLIIVDIAPVNYLNDFQKIFDGLKNIPLSELTSRQQADNYLAGYVDERPVRQFLLQNLVNQSGQYTWRIPLHYIENAIQQIIGFPDTCNLKPYQQPALFIGGKQSAYLSPEHIEVINNVFRQNNIEIIENAGHWVHAEQPYKVLELIRQF